MTTDDRAAREPSGAEWTALYRAGGAAALGTAALTGVGVVTYLAWPPPTGRDVATWLALFARDPLAGMVAMDLVMLAAFVALVPVLVALYVAVRRHGESLAALALAFGLVGIATYCASSRVFEMLALSQQYAATTSDAERAAVVAAGQAMLTTYLGAFAAPGPEPVWAYQGTAFNVGYTMWAVAGVLISVVMRRHDAFGRVAGGAGIAGNAAALGLFLPVVGVWLALVSLLASLVWYLATARGLLRLARRCAGGHVAAAAGDRGGALGVIGSTP